MKKLFEITQNSEFLHDFFSENNELKGENYG